MNLEDYQRKFPNERVFWPVVPGTIETGMLLFDETASYFAQPFEGDYVYYRLFDHTNERRWDGPMQSIDQLKAANRLSQNNFAFGKYGKPADNEEHLAKRLEKLGDKERRAWEERANNYTITEPTTDKPISLKLYGNDDSTYTKFYATLAEAHEELALYLIDQPLNFKVHVDDNGFVFTN